MKGLSITTSQVPGGTVTHVVWQIANPQVGIEGEGVVFVGSWGGPGGGGVNECSKGERSRAILL